MPTPSDWIRRSTPNIRTSIDDRLDVSPTVTLVHLPAHFPGSTALHWSTENREVLLAGDSLHVAADRRHISVMHSVANYIPVGPTTILDIQRRLTGIDVDDLYGFTWGLNIIGDARRCVDESLDRYLDAVAPQMR